MTRSEAPQFSVRWMDEVDSTQRLVAEAARTGAPEGLVVAARVQTAGRGRRGRNWTTPPGSSLMCSILLRPGQAGFPQMAATSMAAVEACAALTPARPSIKWPNDLLLGERKLAGILADATADAVVVGLGLNVAWSGMREGEAARFAALSDIGPPPDPAVLLDVLLDRLSVWLRAPTGELMTAYRDHCGTLGRDVRVTLATGEVIVGRVVGVGEHGELVADEGSGRRRILTVGDVEHLRAGGTNSDTARG